MVWQLLGFILSIRNVTLSTVACYSISGKCDSPRQSIKLLVGGYNGCSLGMAPDMAVCIFLSLSSFSPVNSGLNMSKPKLEEKSSEPCNKDQCDRLKNKLEEQEDFYQLACGANTSRPKVELKDSFLDLVRSPPEGYGCVKDFYRSCTNLPTGFTTERVLLECIKDGQGDFVLLCGFLLR